jgi:hypothetical protein
MGNRILNGFKRIISCGAEPRIRNKEQGTKSKEQRLLTLERAKNL